MKNKDLTTGIISLLLFVLSGLSYTVHSQDTQRQTPESIASPSGPLLMCYDSVFWTVHNLQIGSDSQFLLPSINDSLLLVVSKSVSVPANQTISNLRLLSFLPVARSNQSSGAIDDVIFVKSRYLTKKLANAYEGADTKIRLRDRYARTTIKTLFPSDQFIGNATITHGSFHINSFAISVDKKHHVYFSLKDNKGDSIGSVHLYEGIYADNTITNIKPVKFEGQVDYPGMHPAVNSDGTILVFSSSLNHTEGGYDLYYATRSNPSADWSSPQYISAVNTTGNELFPCITSDGYIYFSSDNIPGGLGGLDIYRISLENALAGKRMVEHLDKPINSPSDDYGWTQYSDNVTGYFASERQGDKCNVYEFKYNKMTQCRGVVTNKLNGSRVNDASVFVYDVKKGKVRVLKTGPNGEYSYVAANGSDLIIKVVVNPYDTLLNNRTQNEFSQSIALSNIKAGTAIQNLSVNKLSLGTVWMMDTIYYDFDKWRIKPTSYPVLDSIVSLLKAYPLVNVEISSFADRRGPADYNLLLSQRRADAIRQYIGIKGIDLTRIEAKGYGQSHFINVCPDGVPCSEKFHFVNRRSEIKVVGYGKKTDAIAPDVWKDITKFKNGDEIDIKQLPDNFFDGEK